MHAIVTGHDPVEHACPVRLHGQPRRPVRRRPQASASPGGVRKPRLHEVPVGVPEPCVRQAVFRRRELRLVQDVRELRDGAVMGVHDPVDERRSLRNGRQGVEVAGEGGVLRHGQAQPWTSQRCAMAPRYRRPPRHAGICIGTAAQVSGSGPPFNPDRSRRIMIAASSVGNSMSQHFESIRTGRGAS